MPRRDRLVQLARLTQIFLAVVTFCFAITLSQTNDYGYSTASYLIASIIYDSVGIGMCGVFGMILSNALEGFADHDFYRTLHPLLLMLVVDLLGMGFNLAALACLLVGGTDQSWWNPGFWATPLCCTAVNLVPMGYLLVRTARIYWNGTISAAIAERVQREEHQWYDSEAGVEQRDSVYAKSVARSAAPTELDSRAPRPGNRTSVLSQPLSTVHTELSGPKTLGTAHRSILSAPSRAPPSYVTPSVTSSGDAYNNIP